MLLFDFIRTRRNENIRNDRSQTKSKVMSYTCVKNICETESNKMSFQILPEKKKPNRSTHENCIQYNDRDFCQSEAKKNLI